MRRQPDHRARRPAPDVAPAATEETDSAGAMAEVGATREVRYRGAAMPTPLDQLRGHPNQRAALARLATSGRQPHALVLEGPEGVGKTTIAEAFAAMLACVAPTPTAGCGHCRSCRGLERGDHPDIQHLRREGQGIKIDQIREATRRLRYDPVLGRAKIVLLHEADRLREEAANALLKTLEEPSSQTCFLLVTSRPQLLLDTIRSRCQTLRFGPLGDDDLVAILRAERASAGQDHDPALIQLAAALADGSLRQARLRAAPGWQPVVEAIVARVAALGRTPVGSEVAFVAQLDGLLAAAPRGTDDVEAAGAEAASDTADPAAAASGGGRNKGPAKAGSAKAAGKSRGLDRDGLALCLDLLRAVLRDAVLTAGGIDPSDLPHARWAAELDALARRVGAENLAAALDAIEQVEDQLAYNPSTTLTLEALLARMAALCRG